MGRGPEAASRKMTSAALGPDQAAVCEELLQRLQSTNKPVVERAARTLKKISEINATALMPWRKKLLASAWEARDVRVQWNLSIVLGRLPLKGTDKALTVELMFERLQDKSGLNRTMAMQALVHLLENDAALRHRVVPIIQDFMETGTPAMQARARKLMKFMPS